MSRPTRPTRPTRGAASARSGGGRPARPSAASSASSRSARSRSLAQTRTSPVSTFAALGVVAVALLVGLGYGFSTRSQAQTEVNQKTVRNLPLGSATGVCQGEIGAGSDTLSTISTYTPGGGTAGAKDGAVTSYLDGSAFSPLKVGAVGARSTSGQVTVFTQASDDIGSHSVPVVVQAGGSYAPGFSTSELLRSDTGPKKGMADAPCAAPSTDFWFAGVSAGADRDSFLLLANPDPTPATVNLSFFGASGPIDTGTLGHDITVLPKASLTYLLSSALGANLAKSAVASVHVTTSAGRVAAQVVDADRGAGGGKSTDGRGFDFIPAQAPSVVQQPVQTIPGVPAPAHVMTKVDLVVTATGDQPVSIDHVYWTGKSSRIELSAQTTPADASGYYTHRDAPLSIQPGHTVVLDMTGDLRDPDEAGAFELDGSGGPFLSGVRLVMSDSKTSSADSAYLAPANPVTGQAIVVDNNIGGAAKSTLLLTDVGTKGGTVQVTTAGADGKPNVDTVQLAGNSTLVYPFKASGWFTAVVQPQPGSDPVYGARIMTDQPAKSGIQFTAQTLGDARLTAAVPPVAADLSGAVKR